MSRARTSNVDLRGGGRKAASPASVAVVGFAATTALASAAGLWAFVDPRGPAARLLPLSPPHETLARDYLTEGGRPVDLDSAERETRRELALSPATGTAWLRLAYIDYWRHGRLTDTGLANLARSYEIAPLGPDASEARLVLGLELWASMPESIRSQLLKEIAALRERDRDGAIAFAGRIKDPQGRLVIGMSLAALDSEAALKASD